MKIVIQVLSSPDAQDVLPTLVGILVRCLDVSLRHFCLSFVLAWVARMFIG